MKSDSKLLINEYPLIILPSLAKKIGLNNAIFLQQLHYWIQNPNTGKRFKNKVYIRNSYDEWLDNFPFWSINTVKRTVYDLEEQGFIKTENLNKMKYDRTKWYTIDYEKLASISN